MSTYLDASFAVSLYCPDTNYRRALNVFGTASRPVFVSALCELEAINAIRLRVFRKDATPEEAQQSIRYFEMDLGTGVLERRSVLESSIVRAHQISAQHTIGLGTRGADVLHVATALELQAQAFFSFDLNQRKLAAALGLTLNSI